MRDSFSTLEVVQYSGEITSAHAVDNISTVGVNIITVEGIQHVGGGFIIWGSLPSELKKKSSSCKTHQAPTKKTHPESGPELDLPFLFIREWNCTFVNRHDFRFTGFFPNLCVNAISLPTCLLEHARADQYAIAPMAV